MSNEITINNWTVDLDVLEDLQSQKIMVRRFKDGHYLGWYSELVTVKNLFGDVQIRRDVIGQPVLYSDLEASTELCHLDVDRLVNTDLPIAVWHNHKLLAVRDDNQISEELGQSVEKIKRGI